MYLKEEKNVLREGKDLAEVVWGKEAEQIEEKDVEKQLQLLQFLIKLVNYLLVSVSNDDNHENVNQWQSQGALVTELLLRDSLM